MYVLLVFLAGILVIFAGSVGFVWRFWIIKNHLAQGLHQALVQAANSADSYSVQYADEAGANQVVINRDEARNTFNAVLSLDLGIPSNQYTVDDFVVFGPSDQGQPLPGGYPGVVPGTSIYAHVTVQIPVGQMVGLARFSGVTFYMPLDQLVAPNRFLNPQGQWQGG